ncbi:DMT family transporter [Herpetosiphon llansteffanensis]|uniref:DMT family transporter n=1 Tax=Herpetosiphon llansteffanensis TaxID=2094568 RepID=UPI000D7C0FC7|nr:EamA family transporter [Herpetosiphon llansteffanensis]
MTLRQMGVLMVLALVWGASFLFIRLGVETIPPISFVFLRLAIAAMLIYAVLRWQKISLPRERKLWYSLGFVGFINAALPYCLFAWGEHKMGANASGLASIYNATTPLWTVILAFSFVRSERLTGVRTFGILLGFAGVVYLFSRSIGNINSLDTWGQIACIIASAMYGIGTLYVRRTFGGLPALIPAFGQMVSGALMLLPIAIVVDHNSWQTPSLVSVGSLFGLAILGTAIAQILYFWLVKQVGAARTSQVTYILPIFAIFWGWLFLNEAIRSDMLIGLCLILLGVIIVNGKWPFRRQSVAASSS